MKQFEFQKALTAIFTVVDDVNRFVNVVEPWKLAKGKPQENEERLATVVYIGLESCRVVGLLLQAVMPVAMGQLLDRLGVGHENRTLESARWGYSPFGQKIQQGVLFPRFVPLATTEKGGKGPGTKGAKKASKAGRGMETVQKG